MFDAQIIYHDMYMGVLWDPLVPRTMNNSVKCSDFTRKSFKWQFGENNVYVNPPILIVLDC